MQQIELHVYVHIVQDTATMDAKLNAILDGLAALQKGEVMSQATIDDILAEVNRQTTINVAAKSLLEQLYAMRNDPAKLNQALEGLMINNDVLGQALTNNTPQGQPAATAPAAVN